MIALNSATTFSLLSPAWLSSLESLLPTKNKFHSEGTRQEVYWTLILARKDIWHFLNNAYIIINILKCTGHKINSDFTQTYIYYLAD